MEKNKFQNLSASDLDLLLNRAFLEVDFSQRQNEQMLGCVSHSIFSKASFFSSFIYNLILQKILFFIGLALLTGGFLFYFKGAKPSASVQFSAKAKVLQKDNFGNSAKKEMSLQASKIKTNKNSNIVIHQTILPLIEKTAMISGYIKSFKNGDRLAGAAVYEPASSKGVASTAQGYYSLTLPEGEHIIEVSLQGYLTYTFSVYLGDNVAKNVDLQETSQLLNEVTVKPGDYVFPNLTEKEKKANEKEKQKMARLAARLKQEKEKHAEKYPFIPAPADKGFASFNMGSAEVTNLEYRTFLFDLLISGKKEEFLAAKPQQDLWHYAAEQATFDTLVNVYFSEKKYNFYPVVNIPAAGAEMYCQWLGELANAMRQKEGKPDVKIRLPYEHEWLYAASGGHPGAVYPWLSDSIQNRYNWFLANCCIQKQMDKFKYPFNKTNKHPVAQPRKFDLKAYTSAGMALGNSSVATIEVFAYNPNDFYLYCMCGNVSEMVYANDKKNLKAKGGNWSSDAEHLKLNSDDEFKDGSKPSPMIGFRVCIVPEK